MLKALIQMLMESKKNAWCWIKWKFIEVFLKYSGYEMDKWEHEKTGCCRLPFLSFREDVIDIKWIVCVWIMQHTVRLITGGLWWMFAV